MKRLLILTVLAMLLSVATGCRFMECLWRGPATQSCQPATVCPAPAYSPCDPCAGGTTVVTPGPETYAPAPRTN